MSENELEGLENRTESHTTNRKKLDKLNETIGNEQQANHTQQ
jgi:hypothetical protein